MDKDRIAQNRGLCLCARTLYTKFNHRNNLREIISVGQLRDGWRQEDIMRVKFRLSVLLRAQNRLVESGKIRAGVEHLLMNLRPPGSVNTDATDNGAT